MIALVLGGARSGKSAYAERRAASLPEPVSYVATACVDGDADLAARVDEHRARRPESWTTIEAGPDVPDALRATRGTVVLVKGPIADPYGQLELRPTASGYTVTGRGSLPPVLRLTASQPRRSRSSAQARASSRSRCGAGPPSETSGSSSS